MGSVAALIVIVAAVALALGLGLYAARAVTRNSQVVTMALFFGAVTCFIVAMLTLTFFRLAAQG